MKIVLSTLLALLCMGNIAKAQKNIPLEKLADYMIGSYNSAKQAAKDTNYFDVSLEMVRVWDSEKGCIWLYVEQAITANKDEPYRQRVYQIQKVDKQTFTSTIYTLPDAGKAVGQHEVTNPLSFWKPSDLTALDGCTIKLVYKKGKFVGSTEEGACKNSWRGASYATSEVTVCKNKLLSWDRGWDKDGKYLWGAEFGGYIFKKTK